MLEAIRPINADLGSPDERLKALIHHVGPGARWRKVAKPPGPPGLRHGAPRRQEDINGAGRKGVFIAVDKLTSDKVLIMVRPLILYPLLSAGMVQAVSMIDYSPQCGVDSEFGFWYYELLRNNEDPTTTSVYTDFFAPNGSLVVSGDLATGADAILQARAAMLPTDASVQWDHFPNRTYVAQETPYEKVFHVFGVMQSRIPADESCSTTYFQTLFTVAKNTTTNKAILAPQSGSLLTYDGFVITPSDDPYIGYEVYSSVTGSNSSTGMSAKGVLNIGDDQWVGQVSGDNDQHHGLHPDAHHTRVAGHNCRVFVCGIIHHGGPDPSATDLSVSLNMPLQTPPSKISSGESATTMSERQAKRIRQACQNCRRKKTRCSGERPICAFCARLQQVCIYDEFASFAVDEERPPSHQQQQHRPVSSGTTWPTSADSNSSNTVSSIIFSDTHFHVTAGALSSQVAPGRHFIRESCYARVSAQSTSLPSPAVLKSLTDTYFQSCHSQPYFYFREDSFRRRLLANSLPNWLLLAFVATACRFSDDPFFQGRQEEAVESYADTAWSEIHEKMFSQDDFINVHTVQAVNMLAVIDFTAGKDQRGWVKIGLSVRFAEALNLSSEPDSTLPTWLQEEYRWTFCVSAIDQAGFLIFVASALGRVQEYSFRSSRSPHPYPPWDFRSEFASIHTALVAFESCSPLVWAKFENVLDEEALKATETVRWQAYRWMEEALAAFDPEPEATASLVNPTSLANMASHPNAEEMCSLLDYSWLSDHSRGSNSAARRASPPPLQDSQLQDWTSVSMMGSSSQRFAELALEQPFNTDIDSLLALGPDFEDLNHANSNAPESNDWAQLLLAVAAHDQHPDTSADLFNKSTSSGLFMGQNIKYLERCTRFPFNLISHPDKYKTSELWPLRA
ncbi:hypothetical protein LA080_004324 [Diaporthe eres]|nr:hypothetical protein LA080_004324 [Diaporthe eres]